MEHMHETCALQAKPFLNHLLLAPSNSCVKFRQFVHRQGQNMGSVSTCQTAFLCPLPKLVPSVRTWHCPCASFHVCVLAHTYTFCRPAVGIKMIAGAVFFGQQSLQCIMTHDGCNRHSSLSVIFGNDRNSNSKLAESGHMGNHTSIKGRACAMLCLDRRGLLC